jgi:hypothetical protein
MRKCLLIILFIGVIIMPTKTYFTSDPTLEEDIEIMNFAIKEASKKHGIEEALIRGIIKKESEFFQFAARNDKKILDTQAWFTNAMKKNKFSGYQFYRSAGYMQVLFIVAKCDFGYKDSYYAMFDPVVNIDIGTRILAKQLKRYKGDIKKAISAYNAGHYTENNKVKYTDIVYKHYKDFGGKK